MTTTISINNHTHLDFLLIKNKEYAERYQTNSLMHLIKSKETSNKIIREKLLDCIQIFSNYFQKTIMLRYIMCDNAQFLTVTQQHLQEEFAHNLILDASRNHRPLPWDPILDATAGWFTWKMLTLDQDEKTVLIHLVLETSATIFFIEAHKIMKKHDETNYFEIHATLDPQHEMMGIELLQNLSSKQHENLLKIQLQGWDMIEIVCEQIAKLSGTGEISSRFIL